jgi:hypothetical protein
LNDFAVQPDIRRGDCMRGVVAKRWGDVCHIDPATERVFDPEVHNKIFDALTAATLVRNVAPDNWDIGMKRAIAVCVGLIASAVPAAAESPVAIVEEIRGKVSGAEFMDYLTPRTVIKLGANSSVVISYLNSCRREKIDGIGTVIVGTDESLVHLATVKNEETDCDAGHAHASRETSESAATLVRSIARPTIKPQLTLYGTSPFVQATGRGTLLIERLDGPGERQRIVLDGKQIKGKFYDFAAANKTLKRGGIYSATFRSSRIVFQIDPHAEAGKTPIVGRLVRME